MGMSMEMSVVVDLRITPHSSHIGVGVHVARTSCLSVSMLWLGEIASFYLQFLSQCGSTYNC